MHWSYLAIVFGVLISVGAGVLTLLSAGRRQRLTRETGNKHFEGIPEIASQAGFCGGLLLIAAADFYTLLSLKSADPTIPIVCAVILVTLLGMQLGRLLMRYQLRRFGGLLDTVTGEVLTKTGNK